MANVNANIIDSCRLNNLMIPSVMRERAYDDDGSVTLTTEFDFGSVERSLDGIPSDDQVRAHVIGLVLEIEARLNEWTYQPPCDDIDGFLCRSIIRAWIFCPQLRAYTMTDIAGRFGKHKQSLARWVGDFLREFPELRHIQHVKHEASPRQTKQQHRHP